MSVFILLIASIIPIGSADFYVSYIATGALLKEEVPVLDKCKADTMVTSKGIFNWVEAAVYSSVKVTCPYGSNNPDVPGSEYASRHCVPGEGKGFWVNTDISTCNYGNQHTQKLHDLSQIEITNENAAEIAGEIKDLTDKTEDIDEDGLSLITGILENLVDVGETSATTNITTTFSNLMEVDANLLEKTQASSRIADRLVNGIETVAATVALPGSVIASQISTPNLKITASALQRNSASTLEGTTPGISVTLPDTISANNRTQNSYLVTYENNKFFVTNTLNVAAAKASHVNKSETSDSFINTPVVSVGVGNTVVSGLDTPVNITLPVLESNTSNATCVYYIPVPEEGQGLGRWSAEGVITHVDNTSQAVTCQSNHLTSFAVIMSIKPVHEHVLDPTHLEIMDIISYVCLFISLVALVITILALRLQKSLWRLDMTKVHVYLSLSLLIAYTVFLLGIDKTQSRVACLAVAVTLHVTLLIAFMWMAVEAYTLYLQFVKIFPSYTPYFIPKCMVVVILLPLAIGLSFLAVALSSDVSTYYELEAYCYIKSYTLYYGFIAPVLLIIVCNFVIFSYVTRFICTFVSPNSEEDKMSQFSNQLRAALSVLVMLGIAWIFGAFTFGRSSLFFQYLFMVLSTLQGLAIFVFHVLLKPDVRKKWWNTIQGYTTSLSSNSNALKTSSFHRAHKYEVNQLKDSTAPSGDSRPKVRDTRFTYLSSSNDYATIESRPVSIASDNSVSMNATGSNVPLIKKTEASSPPRGLSPIVTKRPLSTVASLEPVSATDCSETDYSFSPVSHPQKWEYNPLSLADTTENTEPADEFHHV